MIAFRMVSIRCVESGFIGDRVSRVVEEGRALTPFLMNFASAVIFHLQQQGLLELCGNETRAVTFVANYLGTIARGGSLISSLTAALIACPEVEELYADDEQLKQILQDLAA